MGISASKVWLTCGTPTTPGILNSLTAACAEGFVPDVIKILSNPGVDRDAEKALNACGSIIDAYGSEVTTETWLLDEETDFADIVKYYQSSIDQAHENSAAVAVDVTPGRKFMSAIAFQAGMQYGADHVFYFHRSGGTYQGDYLPEIPRTSYELIDFTEEIR